MFAASKSYLAAIRKPPVPEPWMFGVSASVNGVELGPPTICRFTYRARIRMAWRKFRGRPAMAAIRIEET